MPTWRLLLLPPSANAIWRSPGGGRVLKSRSYRAWLAACHAALKTAGVRMVTSPCRIVVTIHGGKGWRRSRDIDNILKPCVDLVREAGIVRNDSTVHVVEVTGRYVHGEKRPKRRVAYCEISVETVT